MRQCLWQAAEQHLNAAGNDIGDIDGTLERNVNDADAGREPEELGSEVLSAADAAGCVIELARVRFREVYQLPERPCLDTRIKHEQIRRGRRLRDGREIT